MRVRAFRAAGLTGSKGRSPIVQSSSAQRLRHLCQCGPEGLPSNCRSTRTTSRQPLGWATTPHAGHPGRLATDPMCSSTCTALTNRTRTVTSSKPIRRPIFLVGSVSSRLRSLRFGGIGSRRLRPSTFTAMRCPLKSEVTRKHGEKAAPAKKAPKT